MIGMIQTITRQALVLRSSLKIFVACLKIVDNISNFNNSPLKPHCAYFQESLLSPVSQHNQYNILCVGPHNHDESMHSQRIINVMENTWSQSDTRPHINMILL